jgi:hypothetical protein
MAWKPKRAVLVRSAPDATISRPFLNIESLETENYVYSSEVQNILDV